MSRPRASRRARTGRELVVRELVPLLDARKVFYPDGIPERPPG